MRELKIDRLKNELSRAREKANEWQARVRDLEKQIFERENMEIVRMVRGIASSPEDLKGILAQLQAVSQLNNKPITETIYEEESEHD